MPPGSAWSQHALGAAHNAFSVPHWNFCIYCLKSVISCDLCKNNMPHCPAPYALYLCHKWCVIFILFIYFHYIHADLFTSTRKSFGVQRPFIYIPALMKTAYCVVFFLCSLSMCDVVHKIIVETKMTNILYNPNNRSFVLYWYIIWSFIHFIE